MKTTLELPDGLINEIRQRAKQQGCEIDVVVADLLTAGLAPVEKKRDDHLVAKTLPLIKVRPVLPSAERNLTPQEMSDRTKDFDLQLDVERYEKAFGHQHVDRSDG